MRTSLVLVDSLTLKNMGPSSASQWPSTAVTHCMYSYRGGGEGREVHFKHKQCMLHTSNSTVMYSQLIWQKKKGKGISREAQISAIVHDFRHKSRNWKEYINGRTLEVMMSS